jgi:predicted amidohydrolase
LLLDIRIKVDRPLEEGVTFPTGIGKFISIRLSFAGISIAAGKMPCLYPRNTSLVMRLPGPANTVPNQFSKYDGKSINKASCRVK